MLVSYVNGFGASNFGAAPSMLQLIEVAHQNAVMRSGFGRGFGGSGFGAPIIGDFALFQTPPTSRTFKSDDGLVFCSKDSANRIQCVLNKVGEAGKAPIRDMQRAIDRIIDLIPTNALAGRQLKGQMPTGDGSTAEQIFTVPSNLRSPVLAASGYDGIAGDSTMKNGILALTLAGMLKAFPNPGIALAFVSPTRTDIWAKFSTEIAAYLNDVANNFAALLAAFNERGNVPIQTQLDVATIPFVVPLAGEKKRPIGAIIGAAAAMIGLTAIGAVSAGKKKPAALYADEYAPAFGRRRYRGHRSW